MEIKLDPNSHPTSSTSSSKRFVVACAGACNVGQVSNQLAVQMNEQRLARMICLTALGAHLPAHIEPIQNSELIVLDGCPVACGRLIAEHVGIKKCRSYVLTEMGLEKNRHFDQVESETQLVWDQLLGAL